MNYDNELRLCARVTALGKSADAAAFGELVGFTGSGSARVRRLAASAIGKLAGIVPHPEAVEALLPLLHDAHPQCRQYAAKALGAFGAAAEKALSDLRDLYKNPAEKDYLDRRNFDAKVELNKTIKAKDGTLVQSDGERRIANWLRLNGVVYRYDERIRIVEGYAIRPDFYLPEFDVYVEYWGMDTTDYKIGMLKKQKLYQQEGKRLVSLHFTEKDHIETALADKLGRYARVPGAGAASAGNNSDVL